MQIKFGAKGRARTTTTTTTTNESEGGGEEVGAGQIANLTTNQPAPTELRAVGVPRACTADCDDAVRRRALRRTSTRTSTCTPRQWHQRQVWGRCHVAATGDARWGSPRQHGGVPNLIPGRKAVTAPPPSVAHDTPLPAPPASRSGLRAIEPRRLARSFGSSPRLDHARLEVRLAFECVILSAK